MRLFFQRVRTIRPNYPLSALEIPSAARICQLVEGLPLAIELAVGWLEVLSPVEIMQEIARGLTILTTASHDTSARHHSILTIFQTTWGQLTTHEQAVMAKLSLFRGRLYARCGGAGGGGRTARPQTLV